MIVEKKWHYGTINGQEGNRLFCFDLYSDRFGWVENGVKWYRLQCSYAFGDWIETNNVNHWKIHGGRHRSIYFVHEELMTFIMLRWT